MKRETIIIKHGRGQNGRAIAFVPLPDGNDSILYQGDLDLLLNDLGLSPFWHYHKLNGVVCYLSKWKRYAPLARVLVGALPATSVTFLDRNKLNLRSDNLAVTAKRRGRAELYDRDGIEPTHDWMRKIIHVDLN